MKTFFLLFAALALIFMPASEAAVLVTTGTNAQGKAYIEIPELKFEITGNMTTTTFALVIKNAFTTLPTANYGQGGSGIFIDGPGYDDRPIDTWTFGMTKADVALVVQSMTSYNFAAGQTWTTSGQRFTLTNATPANFPVFATGNYEIVLQDAAVNGAVLSNSAQAVPEPSALALIAAAAFAVLVLRRKLA